MKKNLKIIEKIFNYIHENPNQRFAQILFNLDINQIKKENDEVRDIYYDSNEEILDRIEKRIKKLRSNKE